jgi:teichuronic acid exporter
MSEQAAELPARVEQVTTAGIVARALAWKALSVVVGQGCWYASLFVLAILLPPNAFGVMAVGIVVTSFAFLLLESGTGGALIIARELDALSVRRTMLRITAAGAALTLLFVLLAAPITNKFAKGSDPAVLQVLAVVIVLGALTIVPQALLKKYMRFKRLAIVSVAATVAASLVAVVAAALGAAVWSLVIRLVLYQLLLAVLTWVAAAGLFPRVRHEHRGPARRAGAAAFLTIRAACLIAWQGDNLIVAASTNTTQLGLYAFAFSLAYLPLSQVSCTIGTVLFPAIASTRDLKVVQRQALKALRLMTLVLLPLLPVAVVLAPGLIPELLGQKWSGAVVPFQILVVAGVGQGITNVLGEVFCGAGGESLRRRARIDLAWSVATFAAIAIGVQLAGIRGAASAHVLTLCCLAAAYAWCAAHTIGISLVDIFAALRGIGTCVIVQAFITATTTLGIEAASGSAMAAEVMGAGAGVLALLFALRALQPSLLTEGWTLLSAAIWRESASV